MGLEIIAFASLAIGAASTISRNKQARKQAKAEKEGRDIDLAQGEINNAQARRQAAREKRIRLARLKSSSENTGTGGSSGLLGAQSALGASFGGVLADQSTAQNSAEGLTAASQRAADARSRSAAIGAWTNFAQQSLGTVESAYKAGAFG